MKKQITEEKFKLLDTGKVQFTDRNMTPTDIAQVAYNYTHIPKDRILKGKRDNLIRIANDLAKLTGGNQLQAGLQSGNKALILFLLKNSLVTATEYKGLYKDLVELHKEVIQKLKKAKSSKTKGGSARTQAKKDMEESTLTEKKMDIGFGRKGSGTTVWNRNQSEHGDYKTIAHISDNGKIDWKIKRIPSEVKKEVEAMAKKSNESVNESISQSDIYKVYSTLNKGDKVEIDRRDGFKSYTVVKGKTKVGKQKIERITLVSDANPRGVKFYLYNRKKYIGLAIGDGASPMKGIRKVTNEAKSGTVTTTSLKHFKKLKKQGVDVVLTTKGDLNAKKNESINEVYDKPNAVAKKKLKGMKKIPAKQFHQMNDYVYYDKSTKKWWFVDWEGDVAELRNNGYLKQISDYILKSQIDINESLSEAKSDFMARHSGVDITIKNPKKKYSEDDMEKLYDRLGKMLGKGKIKSKSVVVATESLDESQNGKKFGDWAVTREDDHKIKLVNQTTMDELYVHKENNGRKYSASWKKRGIEGSSLKKVMDSVLKLGESMNEGGNEPQVITDLRWIVKNSQNKKVKDPKTGKQMRVDLYSASAIVKVYDAINDKNKEFFASAGLPKMTGMAFKLLK